MSAVEMLFIAVWMMVTAVLTIASGPAAPVTFCVLVVIGLMINGGINQGNKKR